MNSLQTLLNQELALYLRTWNYHWNVEGPSFISLHELFEKQYGQLNEVIDELAERMRALDLPAETNLSVSIRDITPTADMLETLAAGHEALSKRLRDEVIPEAEDANDPGTADLLTGFVEAHDKMAWMLRATAKHQAPVHAAVAHAY